MSSRNKIIQLTAENVKRLRAVTITPTGNMVLIGGNNAQGKTSVMDSIAMAVGGKNEVPTMPVRKGQEKASIILDLGDIVIRRTFTAAGGTALSVENKEGAKYPSPQTILDKLTGKLTFDPLAFTRLEEKQQADALKKLVGLDLSDLEMKRKKIYDDRTVANKIVDQAKANLNALALLPDVPATETDPNTILAEIEKTQATNKAAEEVKARPALIQQRLMVSRSDEERFNGDIKKLQDQVGALNKKLADQKNLSEVIIAEITKAQAAADQAELEDVQPLKEKLAAVTEVNRKVRANIAHQDAKIDLNRKGDSAKALTILIEDIDSQKATRLAAVKFPVEGLSFDDSGVLFNGIPFSQASAAEQLRVSVAIAAGMNPQLRVMLVRDGSLLDDESLALLGELATQYDLQVWVERVGKDQNCSVIIEDGEVLAPTEVEPESEAVTA